MNALPPTQPTTKSGIDAGLAFHQPMLASPDPQATLPSERIAATMGDRNLTPKQFGALGEQYAAAWLEEHGWTTLSRNWHTRYGELDIVMLNPEYTVVFVEVKSRRSMHYGYPQEAITRRNSTISGKPPAIGCLTGVIGCRIRRSVSMSSPSCFGWAGRSCITLKMPSEAPPPKKNSHVAKHIVKGVDMAIGSTLSVGLIGLKASSSKCRLSSALACHTSASSDCRMHRCPKPASA